MLSSRRRRSSRLGGLGPGERRRRKTLTLDSNSGREPSTSRTTYAGARLKRRTKRFLTRRSKLTRASVKRDISK
jgi:hypothetical protein